MTRFFIYGNQENCQCFDADEIKQVPILMANVMTGGQVPTRMVIRSNKIIPFADAGYDWVEAFG